MKNDYQFTWKHYQFDEERLSVRLEHYQFN